MNEGVRERAREGLYGKVYSGAPMSVVCRGSNSPLVLCFSLVLQAFVPSLLKLKLCKYHP